MDPDGVVRVASAGDFAAGDFSPHAMNAFEVILGKTWAKQWVLLDMSRTHFVDSAAIGWLLTSQRKFRECGGGLAIHSAPLRVRQMFELLRLEMMLPLLPDEQAAREYLRDASHVRGKNVVHAAGATAGGKR
jgi:anti-anti-sigma regulatory factor